MRNEIEYYGIFFDDHSNCWRFMEDEDGCCESDPFGSSEAAIAGAKKFFSGYRYRENAHREGIHGDYLND